MYLPDSYKISLFSNISVICIYDQIKPNQIDIKSMSGLVLSLLQSRYIIQRTIFLILIFTYSCSYTDTIPYKHTDRYRYRLYKIQIQVVADTDTRCTRHSDTGCASYRYKRYRHRVYQIQGVLVKDI